MDKIKTLFFAASPVGSSGLMVEEEIRAITQKIRASDYRDSIELVPALAARPDDLIEMLNQHKPQIVHFSAHGKPTGEILLLDNVGGLPKAVKSNAIRELFKTMKDNIRVVLLNACYSKVQARAIVKVIDCVIGIKTSITNQAAITFAASFYRALGYGRSVKEAYEQGRAAILFEGIDKKNIPELLVKEGVDPSRIFLRPSLPVSQKKEKKGTGKKLLKVMIASPSDGGEARERLIRELPDLFLKRGGKDSEFMIKTMEWEEIPSQSGKSQDVINKTILSKVDVVIAIFKGKLSTPVIDHTTSLVRPLSGTVEELLYAVKNSQKGVLPLAMAYFCSEEPEVRLSDSNYADIKNEWDKLMSFRHSIEDSMIYGLYKDTDELLELVLRDLHANIDLYTKCSTMRSENWFFKKNNFNSLIEYHTQIFAGRDKELQLIEDFISNTQGGYFFIDGCSGFGKTALLANLVSQHDEFVYHFFNQNMAYRSNIFDPCKEKDFFENVCQQIWHFFGGQSIPTNTDLRAQYLGLINAPVPYGKKLVIVLDGIDEVKLSHFFLTGLFPSLKFPHVYIIFSARLVDNKDYYLTELNLSESSSIRKIRLDSFDYQGVVALLRKALGSESSLLENKDFIAGIHEQSNGDPFYLRFLVEDIKTGVIGLHNIDDVPKGLNHYLDQQFRLLSKAVHARQHADILGHLLSAEGKMSRSDLIAVVDGLGVFNFDEIIRGIRRYLFCNNEEYTICHPRFKEYFMNK
jgi:hypothetical protein